MVELFHVKCKARKYSCDICVPHEFKGELCDVNEDNKFIIVRSNSKQHYSQKKNVTKNNSF